jgi:hypothetical protein
LLDGCAYTTTTVTLPKRLQPAPPSGGREVVLVGVSEVHATTRETRTSAWSPLSIVSTLTSSTSRGGSSRGGSSTMARFDTDAVAASCQTTGAQAIAVVPKRTTKHACRSDARRCIRERCDLRGDGVMGR